MVSKRESLRWSWFLPTMMALALIAGWDWMQQGYAKPVDAQPYHDRVRAEVLRIPSAFEGWTSEDITPQREAVQILKPNVIFSKRYTNDETKGLANLLLVHCREARDMVGHYPPVCYPSSGWTENVENRRPLVFRVGGRELRALEYEFYQSLPGYSMRLHVISMLLLPDGSTATSMDAVSELEADYRRRFFGAGQLQVLVPGEDDPLRRERLAETFIELSLPAIEVIGSAELPERGESGL
ncbi:MAG: exosortase-associated EpsI family protein [Phycisphaeraceae bacterium]